MAFRDDRDALLARADALQREHDRLEHELEGAASERDELRAALAKNERELAKLRKKVAPDAAQQQHRKRLVLIAGLAVLAGLLVVLFSTGTGKPEEPSPAPKQPASLVASSSSAEASELGRRQTQLNVLWVCLTGADLDMRALELRPGIHRDRDLLSRLESCDEHLQAILATDVVIDGVASAVRAYAEAFAAWRVPAAKLQRYYAEGDEKDDDNALGSALGAELDQRRGTAIAASDELRARVMPVFEDRRATLIASLKEGGNDAKVSRYELARHANDFISALIAPDATLPRIEAALAAMVAHRDAHPELDSNPVGMFITLAKEIVRGLRAAGSTVMRARDLHEFRRLTAYYRMAALDR